MFTKANMNPDHLLDKPDVSDLIIIRSGTIAPSILLLLFFTIKFIPFPVIKSIGFAPENIIIMLMGIYLLFHFTKVILLKRKIIVVLFLIAAYFVLKSLFDFLHGEQAKIPLDSIRMILSMLFLIVVCTTERRFLFAIKIFVVLTVINVLFGMLVYLIGEPFISVRQWFVASNTTSIAAKVVIIGKGSQLSGIGMPPHAFGYLMAATPILCASLFLAERKNIWLLCLLVCFVGLLLNAERSAFLMNVVVFAVFILQQRNRLFLLCIFVLCTGITFGAQYIIRSASVDSASNQEASFTYGDMSNRIGKTNINEAMERIKFQMNGIRTVLKHPFSGATNRDYTEEVLAGKVAVITDRRLNTTMAPHNNYVNAGIEIGIWGWLIFILLFIQIKHMLKYDSGYANMGISKAAVDFGIKLSVVAVFGNALFHNPGIFSADFATCTILSFLMALYTFEPDKKNSFKV